MEVVCMKRSVLALLTLTLVLALATRTGIAGAVPIEVRDYGGVERKQWPVTGGVPFGRAELPNPRRVALVDGAGNAVPLQHEVLARWEDGSVKWLLLDFFADVQANGAEAYTLRYGPDADGAAALPSSALTWRETQDGVHIDTGCLRAIIGPSFLQRLSLPAEDGRWGDVVSGPGEMWVTVNGENEGRYLASLDKEAEVEVEQSGPNRVCVRVSGWHCAHDGRRYAAFTLRVHAYAGKPYLRVFHTFTISDAPERGLVTGIGVRVPLALTGERRFNYGGLVSSKARAEWPSWVHQRDWDRQEIVHDGNTLAPEGKAAGFLAVATPSATAGCFVRNWRQLYPKKLEVNRRGMNVWIWPAANGALDLRRGEQRQTDDWLAFKKEHPKAYAEWIDPGTAKSAGITARRYAAALRQQRFELIAASTAFGLARTHEMLFVFLPGSASDDELKTLSASLEEPLLPFVDPRYADGAEALGRFGWESPEAFPQVENYCRRKLDWIIRHQNEWARWWGIIDWGGMQSIYQTLRDVELPGQWTKHLGRHGWRNSEVDVPNHILFHYLRTGDRRIWSLFESTVRHEMDVDTIHLNWPDFEAPGQAPKERQWTRGGMHRHSYDHYSGACNPGHTWNESIVNFYFLTGDRRAYDVALEIGEYTLGRPPGSNFEKYRKHANENQRFDRSSANIYRNVLKLYEMTGEKRWLEEALKSRQHYLDHSPQYLDQQPATFHITQYLVWNFLLDYSMFKDEAIADEIVKMARWHLNHMEQGYDERGLHFPYLACSLAWWITRDDEFLRRPWRKYLS